MSRSSAPQSSRQPAKQRSHFQCSECGWETAKWVGRCHDCQAWGSMTETRPAAGGAGVVGTAATTPAVPAASAEALLPVPVGPADDALHQSGLRCTEIASGLECERRLSDGWRQVARLDMASEAIRGLEVRLVPGTGAFPVGDVPAALGEPATDVVGVDLTEAIEQAVDAEGAACGCTRPVAGGAIHVEGDPGSGYVLTVEVP